MTPAKQAIGESLEYLSENDLLINGCCGECVKCLADEVSLCYDPDTEVVAGAIWPDGGCEHL